MPIQNITDTRAVAHSLQKERVTSKEQPCFMETRWKPTGPDTGLDAATSAAARSCLRGRVHMLYTLKPYAYRALPRLTFQYPERLVISTTCQRISWLFSCSACKVP